MNQALNKASEFAGRKDIVGRFQAPASIGISSEAVAPASTPFTHFDEWFSEAVNMGVAEPNAMALATASASGMPSARIVLLHSFSSLGFVFFTCRESRKFSEIDANPKASILFYWKELRQQIRIEGTLAELPADFTARKLKDAFAGTSAERYGAQSANEYLAKGFRNRTRLWANDKNADSTRWCAFELSPASFEFWEDRTDGTSKRKFFLRTDAGWKTLDKNS